MKNTYSWNDTTPSPSVSTIAKRRFAAAETLADLVLGAPSVGCRDRREDSERIKSSGVICASPPRDTDANI